MKTLKVKLLSSTANIPTYGSPGASALDLYTDENITLVPGEYGRVKTGLAMEMPEDYCMIVIARSSTQGKYGLQVTTGLIDTDYRGQTYIQVHNMNPFVVSVAAGTRIAQGMIMPVEHVNIVEVTELSKTERGEAGFGQFSGV